MKCPYCGELSQKVHSTYEREIQEKTILLVQTFFVPEFRMPKNFF